MDKEIDEIVNTTHRVYHKFCKYIEKTFGKDLISWEWMDFGGKKIRIRNLNEAVLSQRLTGHKVMQRIERYVTKYIPEIKIVRCDDALYAGSNILLIPHPKHGITVIYIPQCTNIQNQFFLYKGHYQQLMKALAEMKSVYKGAI